MSGKGLDESFLDGGIFMEKVEGIHSREPDVNIRVVVQDVQEGLDDFFIWLLHSVTQTDTTEPLSRRRLFQQGNSQCLAHALDFLAKRGHFIDFFSV